MNEALIRPTWHPNNRIRSIITTRHGGVSAAPYDTFNLASHVGDDKERVLQNRKLLRQWLPAEPIWLTQVHSATVVDARSVTEEHPVADACLSDVQGCVLAVLTADCLPVLFANREATVIAVAHAGWRGLVGGILENTMQALMHRSPHSEWYAYLGPAIGPKAFEVGQDVFDAFAHSTKNSSTCFVKKPDSTKYVANIYALAKERLNRVGVHRIDGGDACTVTDDRFYSYRREGVTGRMASLIWIE